MSRAIVSVATGPYAKGQDRLLASEYLEGVRTVTWRNSLPPGCPLHSEVPYAFKAHALKKAAEKSDVLLWADACILPIRSLEPLWARIERDGYLIWRNGWQNAEWTADSAYPDLFPGIELEAARNINRGIPHVVATCFGLSLRHEVGRAILDEYYRLATETRAFCGPWINSFSTPAHPAPRTAICGPQEVRGHRHDQSCLSLLAHRAGCKLVDPPEGFAYKGGETPNTVVVADGAY